MQNNSSLNKAKVVRKDEFFTLYSDIEKEVSYYSEHFLNKNIYLNCDTTRSAFWKYFRNNFNKLSLKQLTATYYEADPNKCSYRATLKRDGDVSYEKLSGNGDFRSDECIGILEDADIVVTNPPFSMFRAYIQQLMEYDKSFLCIGSLNAIGYRDVFPLLMDDRMWIGRTFPKQFLSPDGEAKRFGNICWFTNLGTKQRHEPIELHERYYGNESKYPRYDNYDAINVDHVADIPCDYDGVMGVPITFMTKYCPEQFDIVSFRKGNDGKDLVFNKEYGGKYPRTRILVQRNQSYNGSTNQSSSMADNLPCLTAIPGMIKDHEGKIDGKPKYQRITIRRKTCACNARDIST